MPQDIRDKVNEANRPPDLPTVDNVKEEKGRKGRSKKKKGKNAKEELESTQEAANEVPPVSTDPLHMEEFFKQVLSLLSVPQSILMLLSLDGRYKYKYKEDQ